MVPSPRPRVRPGVLTIALACLLAPDRAVALKELTCGQDAQANTIQLCGFDDPCVMLDDVVAQTDCDFAATRRVILQRTYDAGVHTMKLTAPVIEVPGKLLAAPGGGRPGGSFDLTATAGSLTVPSGGKIDVSGSSAGAIRLTALAGDVDVRAGASITADGKGPRDAESDGGSVELRAGDDVRIDGTIAVDGDGGGGGGEINVAAGLDALGGVKPGGSLTVGGSLRANGSASSGEDAFGADGGALTLSALGRVTVTGDIQARGASPDGSGGTLGVTSADPLEDEITALDGDLTLAGGLDLRGRTEGSGGKVELSAGRDLVLSGGATSQQGGEEGGALVAQAGRDLRLERTINVTATGAGGESGTVDLRAGLAAVGTLTVTATINARAPSGGDGGEITLAGCHLAVPAGVTVDARSGGSIDLAATRSLTLGTTSQFLATGGSIVLTHPPGLVPALGGATFNPALQAVVAEVSGLYPLCPECGDGLVTGGEVCDNHPSADGDCCNATCTAFTCPTVTPTPTPSLTPTPTLTGTPTPTATATVPTPTPTPTLTPPEPTPTATPSSALPVVPPKVVLACERALGRAATRLVIADLKTYEACTLGAFRCLQSAPAGAARDGCLAGAERRCLKQFDRLRRARRNFGSDFTKACGGDRLPFALLRDAALLGFEELEPTCESEIGLPLGSPGAVATCVQLGAACHAERALGVAVPRAGDLLAFFPEVPLPRLCLPAPAGSDESLAGSAVARSLQRCQRDLAVAGRALLRRFLAGARGCADSLMKCRLLGRACGKVAARCAVRLAALEDPGRGAAARLDARVARGCRDLEVAEVLAAAGIGFEGALARCAALGVPGVAAVADAAACVARAYGCGAAGVVRYALPFLEGELARHGLTFAAGEPCGAGEPP